MVALSKIDNGVYRFYSSAKGAHFYTASYDEAKWITEKLPEFQYEGVAYGTGGTASFYRFYNKKTGTHFFTASTEERDTIIAKLSDSYAYEGVGYNVFLEKGEGRLAIHRFYNHKTGAHFFTVDEQEAAMVRLKLADTYAYEGIAGYALDRPKPVDDNKKPDDKKPDDKKPDDKKPDDKKPDDKKPTPADPAEPRAQAPEKPDPATAAVAAAKAAKQAEKELEKAGGKLIQAKEKEGSANFDLGEAKKQRDAILKDKDKTAAEKDAAERKVRTEQKRFDAAEKVRKEAEEALKAAKADKDAKDVTLAAALAAVDKAAAEKAVEAAQKAKDAADALVKQKEDVVKEAAEKAVDAAQQAKDAAEKQAAAEKTAAEKKDAADKAGVDDKAAALEAAEKAAKDAAEKKDVADKAKAAKEAADKAVFDAIADKDAAKKDAADKAAEKAAADRVVTAKTVEPFALTKGNDTPEFDPSRSHELILEKGKIGGGDVVKGMKTGDHVKLTGSFSVEELAALKKAISGGAAVDGDAKGFKVSFTEDLGGGSLTLVGVTGLSASPGDGTDYSVIAA